LHLFWRDAPDGAGIYHATTGNFQNWNVDYPNMGIFPQNNLALAVNKRDNTLCAVCQDEGHNGIMYGAWDGKRWNTGYTGATTGWTPALIYDNDTLYCYCVDGAGYGLCCVTSTNGYT